MRMIVGLGNPGDKYQYTRHNIGFLVVEKIAYREGTSFKHERFFNADVTSFFAGNEKIYLVKPATFMNNSGQAVGPLMTYFNVSLKDIVVIYDDLDMEVGRVRLRSKGSAGGHNGVKSLIVHLGTQEFNRIKVGIGRPGSGHSIVNYVLGNFLEEDRKKISTALKKSVEAANYFVGGHSFVDAMNKFN
ncbi:MAG: aminoacyl-tRNA hydrolase [Lactobacillales bacterium]|jgi:PTH1 family peptidyl-tRNA hydrolase|nr:aminoacyl-tRNA hydrolase [Lactobacillales bacterium]